MYAALSGAVVAAQTDEPISVQRRFNWQTGLLELTVQARIDPAAATSATRVAEAQRTIETQLSGIVFEALLPLVVDSRRTVAQAVQEDPTLAPRIAALAGSVQRGLPRPHANLRAVETRYTVPVFPELARVFVRHNVPFQMEQVLRWVPTRRFTGVIVYAADSLPWHGTGSEALLQPALLPEIYDQQMRPVLERDMLRPDWVERWGVVAYTESTNEYEWIDRVGNDPLRILARGVFGVLPTDLIISQADADRLLAHPDNRELLREGRILVIVPPGMTTAD